ncbi:hypothetical protein, partial [Streptomyces acidiscabies]|uniref:hypothetical protein n=1 Tax=Streptomyces acidiscabies TaxID=42234 RepID=UPI000952A10B
HPQQYLVLPMLPAGTGHQHVRGLTAPRGIAVPADPARAAAAVQRRLGSSIDLVLTALPAWRRAHAGQRRVSVAITPDQGIRIRCHHASGLYELLGRGGYILDPATGDCRSPDGLPRKGALLQLARATTRLRRLGFHVCLDTRPTPPADGPAGPPPTPPDRPNSR